MIKIGLRNRLRRIANRLDPERRLRDALREVKGRLQYQGEYIAPAAVGNAAIARRITNHTPAAIGKIGASELKVVREHLLRRGFSDPVREEILVHSGVFPNNDGTLTAFAEFWLDRLRDIDLLAAWYNAGERRVIDAYCSRAEKCELVGLEPYYFDEPWSAALAGLQVVVVTPFVASVETQYRKRTEVWRGREAMLPDFALRIVAAPASAALVPARHKDWFEAFDDVAARMTAEPFDVAIIGAGALSVPLCSEAKRVGGIGIHLGGSTQVLFGIRGARFDACPAIARLYNEHWIRPLPDETPDQYRMVENGCYW